MLRKLFAAEPYHLVFAENGAEVLALAADVLPDVILLDVMMPYLDGVEVCRRLRADPRLGGVPIVLITGMADDATRMAGLEAGADDFLPKPFDRVELLARVRAMLRFNRYRQLYKKHTQLQSEH
jgi:DNA-binding response OmpR family regulator